MPLIKDIERYPAMTTFVLYKFSGEIFDYDFEKKHRDYKVARERFSFGKSFINAGFEIDENICIACGSCYDVCTFDAIIEGDTYKINGNRCDECGSCYLVCPVNAVIPKCKMEENDRQTAGEKLIEYMNKK